MKPQSIRIVLVAAASLALGSWLTGVFAQQEPSAAPAGAAKPATRPVFVPPLAPGAAANRGDPGPDPVEDEDEKPAPETSASTPGAPPAAAPASGGSSAAPPAGQVAPTTPATGPAHPSTSPSTSPSADHAADTTAAGPGTQPSTSPTGVAEAPTSRPSGSGYSKSSKSRFGSSGRDREAGGEPTTRPTASDVAAVPAMASKPFDKKYEVLLARSLFSKERPKAPFTGPPPGPRETIVVKPPEPPAPEKSMAVRGMSIEGEGDEDDACYAFIEDLPLKTMKRVKKGDKVARGVVVEVTLADLVYEFEGKRTRVPIGHTLDGAPAPAITWSTYTPVATAPPAGSPGSSGSRGGGNDPRGGDSRGGDPRGGDPRGGDRASSGGGSPPPAAPAVVATPGTPTATPTPAVPAATGGTAPATPAATPAPAGAADDLLERMRKRREQESGR
ncbi:hypothetical protein [Humisphaera borealis]|uniref:Uncharacterized protein n=1 Tax=Humisphaera borealis TaxID=2807512 RepID=A0A7M2WWW1_9BACT|nr:hypothetical protein [Humisphaera borealis]QOV89824.1 hypothetical protein IPV69_00165 [Humisphaera borealis]